MTNEDGVAGRMEIAIEGPPDRDRLVATIFYNDEQWAEVNSDAGQLTVELYPRSSGEPWVLPYGDALEALKTARQLPLGELR